MKNTLRKIFKNFYSFLTFLINLGSRKANSPASQGLVDLPTLHTSGYELFPCSVQPVSALPAKR